MVGVRGVHSAIELPHRLLNDQISAIQWIALSAKIRFETRREAMIVVCAGVIDLIDQSIGPRNDTSAKRPQVPISAEIFARDTANNQE